MIPTFMHLEGDEDSGVALVCDHPAHANNPSWAIAYHAGHGEKGALGLPYFSHRQLDGFVQFIADHAATH